MNEMEISHMVLSMIDAKTTTSREIRGLRYHLDRVLNDVEQAIRDKEAGFTNSTQTGR